jgi:hypothetical protein
VALSIVAASEVRRVQVVLAILGAAAALIGFVLIFLGLLVTSYQQLKPTLSVAALEKFKTASWVSIAVAVVGLAGVAISTSWLIVGGGGGTLYDAALAVFFALLAGVLVALVVTWRVMLR